MPLCKENSCENFENCKICEFFQKSLFLIRFSMQNQGIFTRYLGFSYIFYKNHNFTFAKEKSTMYL